MKTIYFVLAATLISTPAHADDPYQLAWQLRPALVADVVRSDTTVAGYGDGVTVASTLLGAYKLTPRLAPLVRVALIHDAPPMGDDATSISNVLLGVTWARPLAPPYRLALFGGVTLPAGGDVAANRAAMAARSAMDNALFAVNDVAAIGGADLAYIAGGLTLQAEATVFQLVRVRGADTQPDETKTNFTSGVHAGYFALPWLSLGAELRYQRWLSTPAAVEADPTGATRDTMTAALGVRFHVKVGGRMLRPGVAYSRPLDDPMSGRGYDVVQIDVPYYY